MFGKPLIAAGLCWLALVLAPGARADALDDALAARDRGEHAAALKLLRPLAEKGNATAQCALGEMHAKGQGVKRDAAAALKWYRQAAEGGSAACQSHLGAAYEEGRGVKQDLAEARNWYRLAAVEGDVGAQHSLGRIYYDGLGVPQDYVEAARWYALAAEQGDANAQHVLGLMYANGRGMSFDAVQAHKWINLAAARYPAATQERADAVRHRDQIASKMTVSQLAEAQAQAREWRPGIKVVMAAHAVPAEPRNEAAAQPPSAAPTPPMPLPNASEREDRWIYRPAGVNVPTDVAVFLASDYSAVLFRARCEPKNLLVIEYFGRLPLRGRDEPTTIVVNEEADDQRRFPLEMQMIVHDGQEVREGRLSLSPAIAEAILAAREISIDAPNEMGEPWRAGTAAALRRVVRSCQRAR
jgi:hypothetical protein